MISTTFRKVKMSDPPDFYNQAFNSRAVVFDKPTERSGQHHRSAAGGGLSEAMRKTRSIAPAPRAIGDYVLRGLNGLRSKTHEPVLFERSEFTGECAEQLIESRKLSTAARRCGCRAGTARLLFFCRRFLFQTKRKCRSTGSIYLLIIVRREDRVQILQFHIVPLARQRCVESPHPTSCASINLCRFCGRIIFAPTAHLFTIHFYLLL